MCGIVAYAGTQDAFPILIEGLKRLEYRGYDSAGVALLSNDGQLNIHKTKGKVSDLEAYARPRDVSGHIGIAHTRWATHGEPNQVNAHPHRSQSGDIALIDKDMPVVFIATNRNAYEKVLSNIQEVKARHGIIIAVVSQNDVEARKMADYVLEIPEGESLYSPLLATVPLQLLAYHIAVLRGCNVDQPRNLAKSVTVE